MSILLLLPIATVQGGSHAILQPYGRASGDTNILQHSSGKFVYVWLNTTNDNIYCYIYSSSGQYEAMIQEALGGAGTWTCAVEEWNSTHFVMIGAGHDTNACIWFVLCNINTYSHVETEAKSGALGVYGSDLGIFTCRALGLIYAFHQVGTGGATPYPRYLQVASFNGTDKTYTRSEHQLDAGGTVKPWGMIQGFVGEGALNDKAYLVMPKDADNQKPVYYEYDLDGYTITELATHPLSNRYHPDGAKPFQHYLWGSIETSGTLYYVTHTWVYSHFTPTRYYRLVQHRLVFNNTIAVANLTAQSEIVAYITPSLGGSADETWVHGYMDERDEIQLYYANVYQSSVVASEMELTITNWLDYSGGATVVYGDYQAYSFDYVKNLNFNEYDDSIRRDFGSPFSVSEYGGSAVINIYPDQFTPLADWSLGVTYAPPDTPLETDTQYIFTITTTRNGIGTQTTVLGYVDEVQYLARQTEANGILTHTLVTSIAGYHNITYIAYDLGGVVVNRSTLYLFEREVEEAPTTGTMLPQSISVMTYFIPIALVTLLPVGVLSYVMGILGAVIGLNIGLLICSMAGLIPAYTLYLIILFDAILVVYLMRNGG